MITIEVNQRPIEAKPGETILSALRRSGIQVPTLCHMEGMAPTGACRMCVVEVEGQRNLIPSCAHPVADGMKIRTHSPRAVRARKTIVELLLANHPDDCLYCVRNANCDLRKLAAELGVRQRQYAGNRSNLDVDMSSPSIIRDPAKCILCGKCVRVCEEIQGVGAIDFVHRGCHTVVDTAFRRGLNVSSCINCGQCIVVCPTGALSEQSHAKEVLNALNDPDLYVIAQHAPSVSVTLGEEFGLRPGSDVAGIMTATLRKLGFDRVFDTGFAADLTIMEEASELVHRVQNGGPLPMMTSCSPGWVKFVEQFYPDLLGHVSTCKSPQQMMGAVVKSYFAEQQHLDPARIFSVSIMPCTAKKFEAGRPEMMGPGGVPDVDAVLTTRELVQIIRMHGLDLQGCVSEAADNPFGERSSAGKLFGAAGGVMEAAIRTAHFLLTGTEMPQPRIPALRGPAGIKEARVRIGDLELGVAAVNGLAQARRLLEQIRQGRKDLHFVEVMTCPGGCVGGGGQPHRLDSAAVRSRMQALYNIDREDRLIASHRNPSVNRLYAEFLGDPCGEKSHELLHTHYVARETVS
ncbi:MAG: NADH-dependent [FeFe] hydrogenase, group A6 [Candidatus Eisenbacteria bacterium]